VVGIMTRVGLVLAAAVVAGLTAGSAGAPAPSLAFAPRVVSDGSPEVSSNWSGYFAVAPASAPVAFTDVTGTWVQPKARCVNGRADAVAFWVGLGGSAETSPALEQIGTTATCQGHGPARYFAWWEIVPASAVQTRMKVVPGDRISAAVLVKGQKVTMSLKNVTRGTRFSKTVVVSGSVDVSSAEWIAEAPSSCTASGICSIDPLTNFGRVTFTNAALTGNGQSGTIADPGWSVIPVQLITDESSDSVVGPDGQPAAAVGAVPGAVSPNGRTFTVSWERNVTPPPTAP
jgi:hypothetical protein